MLGDYFLDDFNDATLDGSDINFDDTFGISNEIDAAAQVEAAREDQGQRQDQGQGPARAPVAPVAPASATVPAGGAAAANISRDNSSSPGGGGGGGGGGGDVVSRTLPIGKGIMTPFHLTAASKKTQDFPGRGMHQIRNSILTVNTPSTEGYPQPPGQRVIVDDNMDSSQAQSKRKNSHDGDISDKAVAERRLRNREHAKRSRVRKKFMLESLQEEVRHLQMENARLRLKIQKGVPNKALEILQECCSQSELFADGSTSKKQQSVLESVDYSLITSLTSGQQNFVLSDPRLPDNPIVFASEGFYQLTGYTRGQVLGRNCRFLQGPGTDPAAVEVIRKAVESGNDATVCLLNYRSDGTPFWNQFFVGALRDEMNEIVNYVGVQCPVEPVNSTEKLEKKVNEVLPLNNSKSY